MAITSVAAPAPSSVLTGRDMDRYFRLNEMLLEFARLFDYEEPNDRSIAVVGPAFLDSLLHEMLASYFVQNDREIERLLRPDGPLGTYSARATACYCLGLLAEPVLADLRLVGKVRNRFAHELGASFDDPRISSWCSALNWHRFSLGHEPPPGATPRDLFQVGVNTLVSYLDGLVSQSRLQGRQALSPEKI